MFNHQQVQNKHTKYKKEIGFINQSEVKTSNLILPFPKNKNQDKDFILNRTSLLLIPLPKKL